MSHSRKKLDLAGQRFGKLTVLAPAENIGGRTAWLCRCDCGKEAVVKADHLRSGHTVSCGCVREKGIGTRLTYIDGTCVEMLRAKRVRKNNTRGVTGVEWKADQGVWRASIHFKGRRKYLGCYHRFEDAVRARKEAEAALHDSFLREFDEADAKEAAGS